MTSRRPIRFDDSLNVLVGALVDSLGGSCLERGVALRDSTGRLGFFSAEPVEEARAAEVAEKLRRALGAYCRSDRVLVMPGDPGATSVLNEAAPLLCRVGDHLVRVIDRRVVGADWIRPPAAAAPAPARFVFASLKGGVGRSTALAVTAAHIAAKGGRVLAIDFDLEAPGLGSFLLNETTIPEFGALDYFVENAFGEIDEMFLSDLVGPCGLAPQGGRIDVIPAFGKQSLNHPSGVIAKLGRAYVEDLRPDGSVRTFLDQARELVDAFADESRYDVILIDARAGLHEATPSAILGLGAEVLLFGMDEPQTFHGYAPLLAHLSQFRSPLIAPEWLDRLTPVHAKAPADERLRAGFTQQWQQIVRQSELLRSSGAGAGAGAGAGETMPTQEFSDIAWDDSVGDDDLLPPEEAVWTPIAVLRDDRYERFDPMARRDLISSELYQATFGQLLRLVEQAVFPPPREGT